MADIVLRKLEDDLKEKLRQHAASNQRAMNAELREMVSAALAQPRRSSRADLNKLVSRPSVAGRKGGGIGVVHGVSQSGSAVPLQGLN